MSRQPTWDTACRLQGEMFREAAAIGGLDVQLVYFRGLNECRASRWVSDGAGLGDLMARIDCRGGHTQIRKVLSHARAEARRAARCAALVYVGDAMEEAIDDLAAGRRRARAARHAGVRVPGGPRPDRRAGVPRDRAADARRLLPLRSVAPRMSSPSCCARPRSMRRAASRRSPISRRSAARARRSCSRR